MIQFNIGRDSPCSHSFLHIVKQITKYDLSGWRLLTGMVRSQIVPAAKPKLSLDIIEMKMIMFSISPPLDSIHHRDLHSYLSTILACLYNKNQMPLMIL